MTNRDPEIIEGLREIAMKLARDTTDEIRQRHIQAGQKATGKTSALLGVRETTDGCNILGWKYTDTYEVGRANGRMPDIEAIKEWVQAKHLDFNKTPEQVEHYVYCIAYKIAREGTQRFRNPQKPDIYTTPLNKLGQALSKEVSLFLTAELIKVLKPDPHRDA